VIKATLEIIAIVFTCYIAYPLAVDSGYYPTGWFAHICFVLGIYGIFYTLGKR